MELINTKPFNDDYMVYNTLLHRYVLTENVITQLGGDDVYALDQAKRNRILLDISNSVYNFIYSRTNSHNRDFIELILATSLEARELIKQALISQLNADIESGINDIKKIAPINPQTYQTIKREELANNMVCVECENIIQSFSLINLLYAGDYGQRLPLNKYILWSY